ncbi:hypothetical protein BUALT_Bualt16G0060700 [Buddleja alternifolia]|uniref:SWIM-type domain-containing protein n=1 Tax=Buddleja alternifolia TaxID=168488 RepID=A0AAV6WFR7_9LAMI|nr:hypothetical protein BUALT_Bualt16G0060700 [Buddleja alternifolia]
MVWCSVMQASWCCGVGDAMVFGDSRLWWWRWDDGTSSGVQHMVAVCGNDGGRDEHIEVHSSIIEEFESRLAVGQTDVKDERRSINRKPVYQKPITRTKQDLKLGENGEESGSYRIFLYGKCWATAFSNDKFSAGHLATSRSEGTNSCLKKTGASTISLYNFVLKYEKAQENWLAKEKAEDTHCRHGKPPMIVKNNPLSNHAANVYTLNMYHKLEEGLVGSLSTTFELYEVGDSLVKFKASSHGPNSRVRQVVFDKHKCEVQCSCHKFETIGILCKHASKALDFMTVGFLPESYMKKRRTKNVRNRVPYNESGENGSGHVSKMVFVNQIMRSTHDTAMRCKVHEETRKMMNENLKSSTRHANSLFEKLNLDVPNTCDDLSIDDDNDKINEVVARNPLFVKSRGVTNARIRGHWDDKSKSTIIFRTLLKGKANQPASRETTGVSKVGSKLSYRNREAPIVPPHPPFARRAADKSDNKCEWDAEGSPRKKAKGKTHASIMGNDMIGQLFHRLSTFLEAFNKLVEWEKQAAREKGCEEAVSKFSHSVKGLALMDNNYQLHLSFIQEKAGLDNALEPGYATPVFFVPVVRKADELVGVDAKNSFGEQADELILQDATLGADLPHPAMRVPARTPP